MSAPFLPTLNATLNITAAVCLTAGWLAIRTHRADPLSRRRHRAWMLGALTASSLFLISYLYYHLSYPAVHYRGPARPFYLALLASHVILAAALVPFVVRLAWLALSADFARHARLARRVWPVWMYVSITGVIVYLLLYHAG